MLDERKKMLALDAEELLNAEMHELKGGYSKCDSCSQSCSNSCSPGGSKG